MLGHDIYLFQTYSQTLADIAGSSFIGAPLHLSLRANLWQLFTVLIHYSIAPKKIWAYFS